MKDVVLSPATYEFIMAEALAIHALCDRALIPKTAEGETLTMAQRVNVLEQCYRSLVRDVGKVDPTVLH